MPDTHEQKDQVKFSVKSDLLTQKEHAVPVLRSGFSYGIARTLQGFKLSLLPLCDAINELPADQNVELTPQNELALTFGLVSALPLLLSAFDPDIDIMAGTTKGMHETQAKLQQIDDDMSSPFRHFFGFCAGAITSSIRYGATSAYYTTKLSAIGVDVIGNTGRVMLGRKSSGRRWQAVNFINKTFDDLNAISLTETAKERAQIHAAPIGRKKDKLAA